MAIKYLDAKRIRGTAAERAALSGNTLGSIAQTSWKELDRVTLGSAGDVLDTGTFAAKDNLMILLHITGTTAPYPILTFNNDTGSNYAIRFSNNGANDGSNHSQAGLDHSTGGTVQLDHFATFTIRNIGSEEKLVIGHTVEQEATGAGTAPNRKEIVGKWANTANQITRVELTNSRSGHDFASGSEMVILGCDDDEADSGTNFWQELGTDTLDSADQISSGTITAKKYIFGEFHATGSENTGSRPRLRFNNDTGNTYASRFNNNGGSDETPSTSYGSMYISESDMNEGCLATFFIVNVSNKEKLAIYESVRLSATGSGNIPQRFEGTGKWANTSAQITEIDVIGSNVPALPFDSGTSIRVWGSD